MANIHLVGGEKGGVGKSVMARLLAQYLIDHNQSFIGFDTDRSHGALLRFYGDFSQALSTADAAGFDRLVEAAVEQPERRVLVDLAAQTNAALSSWIDEGGVLDMAQEAGFNLRYWHVMDSGRDSVSMLESLLDRFGSRLNIVVVLNQLRSENFEILEKSGQKARAEQMGAQFVTLKRLHETVMDKIDATSASFWSAVQSPDVVPGSLGLMERQRAKMWIKAAYAEIDKVGGL